MTMKDSMIEMLAKIGEENFTAAFRAAIKELHAQQRAQRRALADAIMAKGLTLAQVRQMIENQEVTSTTAK